MKSKSAFGTKSLWHKSHRQRIENLIRAKARENSVQILDAVNMGSHLHMKIRIADRKSFQRFLRTIAGLIARIVLKAEKGRPHPNVNCATKTCARGGHFWDSLAYTRILTSTFEELQLRGYFRANRIERAKGYPAREKMLRHFNEWIQELRIQSSSKKPKK